MAALLSSEPVQFYTATLERVVLRSVLGNMVTRESNVFAEASFDRGIKLAIVRDLERLYAPLMDEEIPPGLKHLLTALQPLDGGTSQSAIIEETTEG